MARAMKVYPAAQVERFAAELKATGSIKEAARRIGKSKTVGRGILLRRPDLRVHVPPKGALSRTHGMFGTPEHRAWAAMKNRCFGDGPNSVGWRDRGIR